ncbi:uncharacterized protein LOC131005209 isoform X2 [Salvia miltiorrhiza]|nr:uncharacterized protein LOC131005209 isoform X2 [Salvia miltiorrhiza]
MELAYNSNWISIWKLSELHPFRILWGKNTLSTASEELLLEGLLLTILATIGNGSCFQLVGVPDYHLLANFSKDASNGLGDFEETSNDDIKSFFDSSSPLKDVAEIKRKTEEFIFSVVSCPQIKSMLNWTREMSTWPHELLNDVLDVYDTSTIYITSASHDDISYWH